MDNFKKFIYSLTIAISGVKLALKEEQSFRIQSLIGIIVFLLMFILGLTLIEKTILILVISMVLGLELVNSQIEKVLDLIQPAYNLKVKFIKDLSAGAVLVAVLGSIIVGFIIFTPYICRLLN